MLYFICVWLICGIREGSSDRNCSSIISEKPNFNWYQDSRQSSSTHYHQSRFLLDPNASMFYFWRVPELKPLPHNDQLYSMTESMITEHSISKPESQPKPHIR